MDEWSKSVDPNTKSWRNALDEEQRQIWDVEANMMAFEITRMKVETGLTFSSEAFDGYLEKIVHFIGSRLMKYWEATGEPPTVMRTVVSVVLDHGAVDPARKRMEDRPERQALKMLRELIKIHAAVQMDTPEDKALHAEVIQTFEEAADTLDGLIP